MSVPLDADRLRYELAIRALSAHALARQTRLSDATVSAALAGKPIAEDSAILIIRALDATAPVELLARLVALEPYGRRNEPAVARNDPFERPDAAR